LSASFVGTCQIEVPVAYVERANGYCDVVHGDTKEATGGYDGRRYCRIRRNHQIEDGADFLVLVVVDRFSKDALFSAPTLQQCL